MAQHLWESTLTEHRNRSKHGKMFKSLSPCECQENLGRLGMRYIEEEWWELTDHPIYYHCPLSGDGRKIM